jgi:hypothetical protein
MNRLLKRFFGSAVAVLAVVALAGCAGMGSAPASIAASPQVKLERVEIASYFPYATQPARVPLILAFVFSITNPNDHAVTLEELRFAYSFEVKGRFFTLNSPAVYDQQSIPARATNQLRVVSVLDSAIVPATLAVTQGFQLQELGVKPPELVQVWWETIVDFAYAIRISEGVATFTAGQASTLVTFQDIFKKN